MERVREAWIRLLRWWRVMEGSEDLSRLCKDVEASGRLCF